MDSLLCSDYKIPDFLIEASRFNDLIHLNQLNDIKNQEFNHFCFIGSYSKLFKKKYDLLKNKNDVFRDLKNQIFLTNDLGKDEFKPVHTPFSFPCKVVKSFDDVYNGLIIYDQYYILVNTDDDILRYNVYTINKNTCKETNSEYLFFVLIGKIINPVPYKLENVNEFELKYNLKLSSDVKKVLSSQIKTLILNLGEDNKQKIFYLNLNGNADLYKHLDKKTTLLENQESNDLETFRKPLLKIWQQKLLGEEIDQLKLDSIREEVKNKMDHFFDGFLKIGTIENENYKNIGFTDISEHKLVVELYMLLNTNDENQGTLWLYHINEPGNANIKDINYLPIMKIFKIGNIISTVKC